MSEVSLYIQHLRNCTKQHTSAQTLAPLLTNQNGTQTPQWHVSESSWQGLSLSHTQTSPRHQCQSSECSMAGTPHRQSEWSQQTCRSLLLRSAKTPLLQGGLRVSSRAKWKPSSLKLPQVWPRHSCLARGEMEPHTGLFSRVVVISNLKACLTVLNIECTAGIGGWYQVHFTGLLTFQCVGGL